MGIPLGIVEPAQDDQIGRCHYAKSPCCSIDMFAVLSPILFCWSSSPRAVGCCSSQRWHIWSNMASKSLTYIGYWGTGQQQAGRSPDLRQACRNPQRGDLGQPWLWGYHNKQPLGLRCLKDGIWLYRLYPINPMWHDGGTYGFVQRKSGTFKIELIASSLSSWKLHSPSFAGISAGKFDMATEIYFFCG